MGDLFVIITIIKKEYNKTYRVKAIFMKSFYYTLLRFFHNVFPYIDFIL